MSYFDSYRGQQQTAGAARTYPSGGSTYTAPAGADTEGSLRATSSGRIPAFASSHSAQYKQPSQAGSSSSYFGSATAAAASPHGQPASTQPSSWGGMPSRATAATDASYLSPSRSQGQASQSLYTATSAVTTPGTGGSAPGVYGRYGGADGMAAAAPPATGSGALMGGSSSLAEMTLMVDEATRPDLPLEGPHPQFEPIISRILTMVRGGEIAAKAIKNRLKSKNERVLLLTLALLQQAMEECASFYIHVANMRFFRRMWRLVYPDYKNSMKERFYSTFSKDTLQRKYATGEIDKPIYYPAVAMKVMQLVAAWGEEFERFRPYDPKGEFFVHRWRKKQQKYSFPPQPAQEVPAVYRPGTSEAMLASRRERGHGSGGGGDTWNGDVPRKGSARSAAHTPRYDLKDISEAADLASTLIDTSPDAGSVARDEDIAALINTCKAMLREMETMVASMESEKNVIEAIAVNEKLLLVINRYEDICLMDPQTPLNADAARTAAAAAAAAAREAHGDGDKGAKIGDAGESSSVDEDDEEESEDSEEEEEEEQKAAKDKAAAAAPAMAARSKAAVRPKAAAPPKKEQPLVYLGFSSDEEAQGEAVGAPPAVAPAQRSPATATAAANGAAPTASKEGDGASGGGAGNYYLVESPPGSVASSRAGGPMPPPPYGQYPYGQYPYGPYAQPGYPYAAGWYGYGYPYAYGYPQAQQQQQQQAGRPGAAAGYTGAPPPYGYYPGYPMGAPPQQQQQQQQTWVAPNPFDESGAPEGEQAAAAANKRAVPIAQPSPLLSLTGGEAATNASSSRQPPLPFSAALDLAPTSATALVPQAPYAAPPDARQRTAAADTSATAPTPSSAEHNAPSTDAPANAPNPFV
ncbi:hypothetical protein CDCA_CDCA14G3777 [Cyanidium caldarium]|uniref:VHS domain-containing protein n=1 Tax=Cyanidium caldarium TaxID=2771 RepID=A0AAV9IZI8_CYACA|nr:hypothetical protein CDCA_CDCA14G3777 [Cyanidium caldarium]